MIKKINRVVNNVEMMIDNNAEEIDNFLVRLLELTVYILGTAAGITLILFIVVFVWLLTEYPIA